MSALEGMPGEDLLQKLRDKWGFKEASIRNNLTAVVLENQTQSFRRLTESLKDKSKLDERFVKNLFDAVKSQLKTHALPDLCAMQPMTGPVGIVYWYQHSYSGKEDGVPTVRLDIDRQEIMAECRRVKAHFAQPGDDDNSLLEAWNAPANVEMVVEEYLTEVAREILGTMLNLCENEDAPRIDYVQEGETFADQLPRTAHQIHLQTQRAPANRVIGDEGTLTELGVEVPISNGQVQDLGVWNGRYRVYFDPLFPPGKLMAWYQSDTSALDTGLIYSPYTLFEITPTSLEPPENMCVSPYIRLRHKITLVRPEFFRVIQR